MRDHPSSGPGLPFPEPSRWVQWSYASFDRGDGHGGWQFKEMRGELDAAEMGALGDSIVTAFDSHASLPEYPTDADIAAQPRRLSYGPLRLSTYAPVGVYAHAVQAGRDATGRPGNVFTHGLIDRAPGRAEPGWRPIELWRSFDWLAPYGPDAVLDAGLPAIEAPRPSGLAGPELTLDFLFEQGGLRIGALRVLMDAVAARMQGGQPVVLATASPDEAAMWIAAVSFLMAPGTARSLSWSVYERAGRLRQLWERGTDLACIPIADAPEVPAGGVLLRGDEAPWPGLGEWSELAGRLLRDRASAEACFAGVDAIAERAGEVPLAPEWPLAMHALVSCGEDAEGEQEDGCPAALLALRHAPPGLADEALRELLQRERLTRLRAVLAEPGGAHPASGEQLEVPAWLAHMDAAEMDALAEALPEFAETAERALRLADILARSGTSEHEGLRAALITLLARHAVPALAVPGMAGRVLSGSGCADPLVREQLIPGAVRQSAEQLTRSEPGHALAPETLAWLAADGGPPDFRAALAEPFAEHGVMERDLLIEHVRQGRIPPGCVVGAAAELIRHYGSWEAIPPAARIITPAMLWQARELSAFETALPGQLPADFHEPTIACAPEDAEIKELAELLARREAADPAALLAKLVLAAEQPQQLQPAAVRAAVAGLRRYGAHLRITRFAPALLDAALRAGALEGAELWRPEELEALRELSDPEAVTAALPALLQRVTGTAVTLPVALVALASWPRASLPAVPEHAAILGELPDPEGGSRPARLLDRLAAEALAAWPVPAEELERQLAEAIAPAGARQDPAKLARAWLRGVQRITTTGTNGKEP